MRAHHGSRACINERPKRWITKIICQNAPENCGAILLSPNRLATDLDTKRGRTDAYKRDAARQAGQLKDADLQL